MKTINYVTRDARSNPDWDKGGKENCTNAALMPVRGASYCLGTLAFILGIAGMSANVGYGLISLSLGILGCCAPQLCKVSGEKARAQDLMDTYIKERANGAEEDNPSWPFPGDGQYKHQKGGATEMFGSSYTVPTESYTEGPKDREWMLERDLNYLRRLKKNGLLDIREPHLETEAPILYRKIIEETALQNGSSIYQI